MNLAKITRTASVAVLKAKQNSPTLFFIAGLAGVGASVVLASKATLELEKTLTPHINQLEDMKAMRKRFNENKPDVPWADDPNSTARMKLCLMPPTTIMPTVWVR